MDVGTVVVVDVDYPCGTDDSPGHSYVRGRVGIINQQCGKYGCDVKDEKGETWCYAFDELHEATEAEIRGAFYRMIERR